MRRLVIALLAFSTASIFFSGLYSPAQQEESSGARKLLTRVPPVYPDLARRTNISGAVRLVLVIAPDGTVKSAEAVGGNPVLVKASIEAVRKWRYASAPEQTTQAIELRFDTR